MYVSHVHSTVVKFTSIIDRPSHAVFPSFVAARRRRPSVRESVSEMSARVRACVRAYARAHPEHALTHDRRGSFARCAWRATLP